MANRPRTFSPVRVGSHGESIAGLLRPGFRSGTLAKIFTKLRAALRLESDPGHGYRSTQKLALIEQVSLAVERFVERDLCVLIEEAGILPGASISVRSVHPATNRFDVELVNSVMADKSVVIRWEDLEGWLVARIVDPGWIDQLPTELRQRVNTALIGLYQQAGVDLVREQITSAISPTQSVVPLLEIRRQSIQAASASRDWAIYSLDSERKSVTPSTSESSEAGQWPVVDRRTLIFRDVDLPWSDWVGLWPEGQHSPQPVIGMPEVISPSTRS